MSTLTVVLASGSGLVFGYATAAHFGARARAALEANLKSDKEKALKANKSELKALKAEVGELKESGDNKAKELVAAKESEAKSHAEEMAKVQAELVEAKAAHDLSGELSAALESAGASLETILQTLIEHEGQTAALLSDANGIKIAGAGDSDTLDRISAASSELVGIPKRLNDLLPLKEHFTFRLQDGEHCIVGHSFESAGELIALMTTGGTAPSEKAIETLVGKLGAALA